MPRGTASFRSWYTESIAGLNCGLPWKCEASTRTPYVIWNRGVARHASPSHADPPTSSPNRSLTCKRRLKLAGTPSSKS